MNNGLNVRYGLFTAICMVVGIVIGSGVFFKAQTIMQITNGNLLLGIFAWIIGGLIMLVCILAFSNMSQKYSKVNGIIDYAEEIISKKYAYYLGWFLTFIYYPSLTSVLAWLSAKYTLTFITRVNPSFPLLIPASQGGTENSPECLILMFVFLCLAYATNTLSPALAGKLQTSTTIIKMIPLILMAVIGSIYGLLNDTLIQNFNNTSVIQFSSGVFGENISILQSISTNPLFASVCSTAFAYDGWIIATTINAELRNPKKTLPRAMIIGSVIIILTYIFYYIGLAGCASAEQLIKSGATIAFINIFGNFFGNILNLFVAISCLGALNGLMLGSIRGMYSLSSRCSGKVFDTFTSVDTKTNIPGNSSVMGLLVIVLWAAYYYIANVSGNGRAWFGRFCFDSSEIPIISIYAFYIPIFFMWIKKSKKENFINRFILPNLAILGSCFMISACIISHKLDNLYYLIVFSAIMFLGKICKPENFK